MKKIEILGTGCAKCCKLAANAEAAAKEMGIDYKLGKVTQISDIMKYGVMVTPALVIDGQVKSSGKALDIEAVKELLK